MKRIHLTLIAIVLSLGARAQVGEIVYTDFDPDITLTQGINSSDTIRFDIDQDGSVDLRFFLHDEGHGIEAPCAQTLGNWSLCGLHLEVGTMLDSDTLRWYMEDGDGPWNGADSYYGWLYVYDGQLKTSKRLGTLFIDRMAYCTIPNYPLMVGQTDFTWDVDETGAVGFAVVQPNPTDGQVTVWGKDLSRAEVFNALGQHVASVSGQGERLVIRLDGQPAGIYFVEVTDTQGRRCVKKLVKQ